MAKFEDYKDSDYLIVIPSRNRSKEITRVQEMFPNAVLYVNEEEAEDYADAVLPVITHDKKTGYSSVINSLFKRCKEQNIRYVAIFDDDKNIFTSLVGNRQRNFTPEQSELAIVNACQVLEDLDESLYLFSTNSSIIKYQQSEPFKVGFSLPQGAMVVRSDKIHPMKIGMHYYEDFDWLMEYIKHHRFAIIENRYLCISKGEMNTGGSNDFRNNKNEKYSRDFIKKKWGQYVNFVKNNSGNIRPCCMAKLRQI